MVGKRICVEEIDCAVEVKKINEHIRLCKADAFQSESNFTLLTLKRDGLLSGSQSRVTS